MSFVLNLAGLGDKVNLSVDSLLPLFLIVAGLIIASGALKWAGGMLMWAWYSSRGDRRARWYETGDRWYNRSL